MNDRLEGLLALQDRDNRIRTLEEKLQGLRDQEKRLESTLAAEQGKIDEKEQSLNELERHSRERNAEVDDLDAQIRKYDRELDQGLLSFKEMEALREKVEHHRKRMEELEDEAIDLLDQLEAQQADMEKQRATFSQWKSRIDEEVAEVRREAEGLQEEIERERGERRRLTEHIDEALLERYERLRSEMDDPIVPMRDGRCTGCHLSVSETAAERVREGTDIVSCENCMRILYAA